MSDHDQHTQWGWEDPTKLDLTARPTLTKAAMGVCLLVCCISFFSALWDLKFGGNLTADRILTKGRNVSDYRWDWLPYLTEYRLYLEYGYDMAWLESGIMQRSRESLGEFFTFFEIILMRLRGAMGFFMPMCICFLFAVSLGSVRYYNKRFEFRHISSTFNNACIKLLFLAIPMTLIWSMLPFGMELPYLGTLPILVNAPLIGAVWLSSPSLGAMVFGAFYVLIGFTLGANFSREI